MSHFNGTKFVEKLKELCIPGASDLNGFDYDWIFLGKNNSPMTEFWQWIYENVSVSDTLESETLEEFSHLVESNAVLSPTEIDQLNEVNVVDDGASSLQETPNQSDTAEIKKQINDVKGRQNAMLMESLELDNEIQCKNKAIQNVSSEIQKLTTTILTQMQNQRNSIKEIDSLVEFFSSDLATDTKNYFHQVSLSEWLKMEDSHVEAIEKLIEKQFNKAFQLTDVEKDPVIVVKTEDLDLYIPKGPTQQQYALQVNELKRLQKEIALSEIAVIKAKLSKASLIAEVESIEAFIKKLRSKDLPTNANMLRSDIKSLDKSSIVMKEKVETYLEETESLGRNVALLERNKVVIGDYEAKEKRQDYIWNKQLFILDQFILRSVRGVIIEIVMEKEKTNLGHLISLLTKINEHLTSRDQRASLRMEKLEPYTQIHHDDSVDFSRNKEICLVLKELEENLVNIRLEEKSLLKSRESEFKKLQGVQKCLEKCLAGYSGSTSLPSSWLQPDIVTRSTNLEENHWKSMKEVVTFIKDYETKKKILSAYDDVVKEKISWIQKVLNAKDM